MGLPAEHETIPIGQDDVVETYIEPRQRRRGPVRPLTAFVALLAVVLIAAGLTASHRPKPGHVRTFGSSPVTPPSSDPSVTSTTAAAFTVAATKQPTTTAPAATPTTATAAAPDPGLTSLRATTTSVAPSPPPPPAIPRPTTTTLPPGSPVTLFPVPPDRDPVGIARGPDGNIWFTEAGFDDVIARITPQGVITEFHTPTPQSQPISIVTGPDGNLWFIEYRGNNVGRITTSGDITEFPIPTPNSQPTRGITVGPDGAIWFSERGASQIARITMAGQITEFDALMSSGASLPMDIVTGADGNLWFVGQWDLLARMTPAGALTEFTFRNGYTPTALGVDSHGNLWREEIKVADIPGDDALLVRRSPAGDVRTIALRDHTEIMSIIEGPDGAIWFAESNVDRIGRLAPDWTITEVAAPRPQALAVGSDGNIWFTTGPGESVGRLRLD